MLRLKDALKTPGRTYAALFDFALDNLMNATVQVSREFKERPLATLGKTSLMGIGVGTGTLIGIAVYQGLDARANNRRNEWVGGYYMQRGVGQAEQVQTPETAGPQDPGSIAAKYVHILNDAMAASNREDLGHE